MAQHPREPVVREQTDVVAEHAEDEAVDGVRDRLRIVPVLTQRLATDANEAATRSVSECRGAPGRSRSGSENAHFSRSRVGVAFSISTCPSLRNRSLYSAHFRSSHRYSLSIL